MSAAVSYCLAGWDVGMPPTRQDMVDDTARPQKPDPVSRFGLSQVGMEGGCAASHPAGGRAADFASRGRWRWARRVRRPSAADDETDSQLLIGARSTERTLDRVPF